METETPHYHKYTAAELKVILEMLHTQTGYSYSTMCQEILGRSDRYAHIDKMSYKAIRRGMHNAMEFAEYFQVLDHWPAAIPRPYHPKGQTKI